MAYSANTLLTPDMITRASLAILHQKLTFVGSCDKQYDSSFAKEGGKIGDSLRIRKPNQFTVATTAALAAENTVEESVTLQVSNQYHVDMNFTSVDLTMDVELFAERFLEPAMSVLAAKIEDKVMTDTYKGLYNLVTDSDGISNVPNTFKDYLNVRRKLQEGLAPTNDRSIHITPAASVEIVDALKGLFHDSSEIKRQYREGLMGRTAGMDWYENTLIPTHTRGAGESATVSGSQTEGSSSLVLASAGVSKAIKAGDTFTIASIYSVHPETKVSTGVLQRFVVTADVTTAGDESVTLSISPPLYGTNGAAYPKQNISALPGNGAVVTWDGSVSTAYAQMLAVQKGCVAFATADLVMPKGVDFSAREVLDGISMRVVRQYDISNDRFPCRIDVLFGSKAIRPEWGCRIAYAPA